MDFPALRACRTIRVRAPEGRVGANGRKLSRNLIFRFIVACILGERASPMMLRAPNARGPNSIRPWNQPITFSSARSSATYSACLSGSSMQV